MTQAIIGIDPGVGGGIAVLDQDRVMTYNMPKTDEEIFRLLWTLAHELPSGRGIFIEQIPKFCGTARFAERSIMGSSLAVLYGNYRFCCGVLHGMGSPATLLAPLKWQNVVECRNRERLDQPSWKRKLKARAQELFPDTKVTLSTADALLIAYAGRQLFMTRPG